MSTDQSIEQAIQTKGLTAPRITPTDVENQIAGTYFFTAAEGVCASERRDVVETPVPLRRLTFCVLILANGFTVTGESACASPENFDRDIGRKIARQNAAAKVWPLLGFRLRDLLAQPVLTDADAAADLAGTPRPGN
jgi:hypothetical protein